MQGIYTAYPVREQLHIKEFYSIFVAKYPQRFCFPHAFWECVYVVDGCIQVGADDRVYDMSAGELIFHKPLEYHEVSVSDPNGAKVFVFSFSAEGACMPLLKSKVYMLTKEQKQEYEIKTFYYWPYHSIKSFFFYILPQNS